MAQNVLMQRVTWGRLSWSYTYKLLPSCSLFQWLCKGNRTHLRSLSPDLKWRATFCSGQLLNFQRDEDSGKHLDPCRTFFSSSWKIWSNGSLNLRTRVEVAAYTCACVRRFSHFNTSKSSRARTRAYVHTHPNTHTHTQMRIDTHW